MPPRRISRNVPARHRNAAREILEKGAEHRRALVEALERDDLETGFRELASEVVLLHGLVALAPMFAEGAEGLEAYRRRLAALGGGWSEEATQAAAAAADATTDYETALESFKSQLAVAVLPSVTRFTNLLAEWGGRLAIVLRQSNLLRVAMWALAAVGGVLALILASATALTLALLSPFILLALAVDDLVTTFEGGESVIRTFIDELFGVGTTQEIVDGLTVAWERFVGILRQGAELLGLIDPEGPPQRSAQATRRARNAGKAESTPDGAEARAAAAARGGRRGRRGPTIPVNALDLSGFTIPTSGLSDLGAPTIPASSIRGGGATNVQQRIDAGRNVFNISGAGDPEAVAAAVSSQFEERFARHVGRAAETLPQARSRT